MRNGETVMPDTHNAQVRDNFSTGHRHQSQHLLPHLRSSRWDGGMPLSTLFGLFSCLFGVFA